jgi:hypothetical protein
VNCANAFRLGSSNWLLSEKHFAWAFVILLGIIYLGGI